jgi:hypothetical protein
MYDRVKNRRKSIDADIYSEENEETVDREREPGDKREVDEHNDENDNDNKKTRSKQKETNHQNGNLSATNDEMIEENTMDVLNEEEEPDEEEELNHQQTGKYSLRERKPPPQRLPLYGG